MSDREATVQFGPGEANAGWSPRFDKPAARIGLRVEQRTSPPGAGPRGFARPSRQVHVGAPVRGSCRRERFVYTRGDVDIFPAGLSDAWQEDDPGTSLVLQFSPSLLHRAARDMGLDPDRADLEPRCQLRDSHIEHMAWALDAERRAGYPSGLLYTESMGMALAVHLLGRYASAARFRGQLSKLQFRRVTAYIEDHLDQDLSVRRLAAVAEVGASQFKILFRRSAGVPVHQYVVQRRVERARILLLSRGTASQPGSARSGFRAPESHGALDAACAGCYAHFCRAAGAHGHVANIEPRPSRASPASDLGLSCPRQSRRRAAHRGAMETSLDHGGRGAD